VTTDYGTWLPDHKVSKRWPRKGDQWPMPSTEKKYRPGLYRICFQKRCKWCC